MTRKSKSVRKKKNLKKPKSLEKQDEKGTVFTHWKGLTVYLLYDRKCSDFSVKICNDRSDACQEEELGWIPISSPKINRREIIEGNIESRRQHHSQQKFF